MKWFRALLPMALLGAFLSHSAGRALGVEILPAQIAVGFAGSLGSAQWMSGGPIRGAGEDDAAADLGLLWDAGSFEAASSIALDPPFNIGIIDDPSRAPLTMGPIPEPTTLILVGLGLAVFGLWRKSSANRR